MTTFIVDTANDDSFDNGDLAAETADGGGLSLREALGLAQSGDTVTFDSGLSGSTLTLGGSQLTISTSLTIDGDLDNNGTPDITISGNDTSRVFNITGGTVTLDGLTMTHGYYSYYSGANGGGIYAGSGVSLTIQDSVISDSRGFSYDRTYGGGVYADTGSSLTIQNSVISNNTAQGGGSSGSGVGGGIYFAGSQLTISDSDISGNATTGYGSRSGGGIYVQSGTLDISNTSFVSNVSSSGAGITVGPSVTSASLTNITVAYNSGSSAANFYASTTIDHGTFTGNTGSQIDDPSAQVVLSNSIVATTGTSSSGINVGSSGFVAFQSDNILTSAPDVTSGGSTLGVYTTETDLSKIFASVDSTTLNGATGGALSTVSGGVFQYAPKASGVTLGSGPSNTPAVIGGNTDGTIGEDDTLTATGSLTITDADGTAEESFNADTITGTYGSLTVDANGDWSYDLDNANSDVQGLLSGDTLGDTITVHSVDGTAQDITITIGGANDVPSFNGDLTGSVGEDETGLISGAATVADADAGQAVFNADTIDGTYGKLTIAANGGWTYDLTESNSDVQGLLSGDTLGDTFTVHSADGTAQDIVITINGADDAPTLSGLTDMGFTEGDSATIIDTNVTFSDADQDFAGAVLTVSGLLPEDTLSVNNAGTGTGQIGLSGSTISYEGTAIGTLSGGSGSTLTVTLNASATNAGVDALIQNLTYANSSDTPTETRTLSFDFTDAHNNSLAGAPSYTAVTGADNPLNGVGVGNYARPTFVDIDGDGDKDFFVGEASGAISYFENTGNADSPVFTERTGSDNPLNATYIDGNASPSFVDIDHDGDLDVFIGDGGGHVSYFENIGNAGSPVFSERTNSDNPLNAVNAGYNAAPVFADIDGDGDMDAVVGSTSGAISYFENTGNADTPVFVEQTGSSNPFDGVNLGRYSNLSFVDIDGDGDLDAVVGQEYGTVKYFENTGSANSPAFAEKTGSANPFDGIDIGSFSAPVFMDINNDGLVDAFVGDYDGKIHFLKASPSNTLTITVTATNDAATFNGDLTGNVDEDATAAITGSATVADVDSTAAFNADTIAGTYGDLTIDANGDWSYTLDSANHDVQALGSGDTLGDTLTVHAADGTAQDIVITIRGVNDAATFNGDLTGSVGEDETGTISGTATVADVDGTAAFDADIIAGTYGSLTIAANGDWVYDLTESNSAVQGLGSGDTLGDTITVHSADGTAQDITITINGANDAPASVGGMVSATEHQVTSFTAADFGFADVDTGDSLAWVRIDSLPAAGVLTFGNVPVAVGDEIAASDLASLGYSPATNDEGNRSFGFSVSDGAAWSPTASMTIVVAGVNDLPSSPELTSDGVSENSAGAFVGTLSATDPEGTAVHFSVTDSRFRVEGDALYLQNGVSLDYEKTPEITLQVYATDASGLSRGAYVHVPVINVVEGTVDTGTSGNDTIEGTAGADTITGGAGNDTLDGGAGNDIITKGASDPGQDIIVGGDGGDRIGAGGGSDFVVGDGATDGTTRQSLIQNGDTSVDGADTIVGGSGDDTLLGGGWNDDLVNDNGRYDEGEEVEAGTSQNRIWAGSGNDVAVGSGGDDVIGGNSDNDYLKGLDGNDTLYGNDGDDTLKGGAGDDVLYNGRGNDSVEGGAGNDTLWAGAGDDILIGGAGHDTFVFGVSVGHDRVMDFDPGEDTLDFRFAGFTDRASIQDASEAVVEDGVQGLLVTMENGDTIFIANLTVEGLQGADVVL